MSSNTLILGSMSDLITAISDLIDRHSFLVSVVVLLLAAKFYLQKRSNVKFDEHPGSKVKVVDSMNDFTQIVAAAGSSRLINGPR